MGAISNVEGARFYERRLKKMFQRVLQLFTDGIASAGQAMVNLFTAIVAIFYNNGELTFYGIIFLILFVLSIVIFTLSFLFNSLGLGGADDEEDT